MIERQGNHFIGRRGYPYQTTIPLFSPLIPNQKTTLHCGTGWLFKIVWNCNKLREFILVDSFTEDFRTYTNHRAALFDGDGIVVAHAP